MSTSPTNPSPSSPPAEINAGDELPATPSPCLIKPVGEGIVVRHDNHSPVLDVYAAAATFSNRSGLFYDRQARQWYGLVPGKSYAAEPVAVCDVHGQVRDFLLAETKDRWLTVRSHMELYRFLTALDLRPEQHQDTDCSGWVRRHVIAAKEFDHPSETGVITHVLAQIYIAFCRVEKLPVNENFLGSTRAVEMAISRALEQQHPCAERTHGNGAGRVIMLDPLTGEIRRGRGFYGLRVDSQVLNSLAADHPTKTTGSDKA